MKVSGVWSGKVAWKSFVLAAVWFAVFVLIPQQAHAGVLQPLINIISGVAVDLRTLMLIAGPAIIVLSLLGGWIWERSPWVGVGSGMLILCFGLAADRIASTIAASVQFTVRTVETHQVRRVMNKGKTIGGVGPEMMCVVVGLAFATLLLMTSLLWAVGVALLAYGLAYTLRDDPKLFHIWLHSWFTRDYYDAAQHRKVEVRCE